ncbi:MAG TPA: hypothetical protein VKT29_04930 [Terriglobales bacterium]|nr:hypothetical protein [Terriglobales bacterium]
MEVFPSKKVFGCALLLVLAQLAVSVALAQVMPPPRMYSAEDRATLQNYKLTEDHLAKAITAEKQIKAAMAQDPTLERSMRQTPQLSLAASIHHIDSHAKLSEAVRNAGLNSRDFVLTTHCAIYTFSELDAKSRGATKEALARQFPISSSAQQIAFVQAHKSQIEELMHLGTARRVF